MEEIDRKRGIIVKYVTNSSQKEQSVMKVFMEIAKKYQERPCIETKEVTYTYGEIDKRSNQLAYFLKKRGLTEKGVVGIYLERSPEMIIGMLAIWKLGMVYVPIATTFPKERIKYMISDASIHTILTSKALFDELNKQEELLIPSCILLDEEQDQINREKNEDICSQVEMTDLAYIIYTSGSTGKPKGVMIEHKGIPNLVHEQIQVFDLTPEDRVLQFATVVFDASISEILTTILSGATLVLLPNNGFFLGEDLYHILKEERISVVTLTPSVLNTLPHKDLPNMKTVVSAGEACSKQLIQYWANRVRFINAYGPTECTVCVSMHICTVDEDVISLGNPIKNTTFYLVDEEVNLVKEGEEGELCISGIGLARGYLHLEEETSKRFIENPFQNGDYERLYRTGDICRYTNENSLEWVARIDNQVKIGGLRIDLDEIRQVLKEYPGIKDGVAIVVENSSKNKQIYCYIIQDSNQDIIINEVKQYLRTKIPAYMVPSRFLFVSDIPVLESGKLDISRLPSLEHVRPEMDNEYVAPTNSLEEDLAAIFTEILEIDRVGIYDNFFDLGGQSLMATQVVSRIRGELGMDIPIHVLFEDEPVIANMANAIERYQMEQLDPEELDLLLEQIESMSEEEVVALLGKTM